MTSANPTPVVPDQIPIACCRCTPSRNMLVMIAKVDGIITAAYASTIHCN